MFEPATTYKKYIKCGVWGGYKEGKTTFALSFPKPCVADSEEGTVLFSDKFQFHRAPITRWGQLPEAITYLRNNPGKFETLIFDSVTPLYADLVDEVARKVKERSGSDFLSIGDRQIIKRKFRSFLRALIELPMHIVVTMRGKAEWQKVKDQQGRDSFDRTGEIIADVDDAIMYDFDFIFKCFVEDASAKARTKKQGEIRYKVMCTGSRRAAEIPIYKTFDLTNQKAFDVIFAEIAKRFSIGKDLQATTAMSEISLDGEEKAKPVRAATSTPVLPVGVLGDAAKAPATAVSSEMPPPPLTEEVAQKEIREFTDNLLENMKRKPGPLADTDDLKLLYTLAGQLAWPDGTGLSSSDAKSLIKSTYGVESGKELTKPEVEELDRAFKEVLAKRASLARRENGVVYIRSHEPLVV